jgi:tubulysin polyketide synthase-like protein
MSPEELVTMLRERGVQFEAQGDVLRWRPRSAVPPELREQIVTHKSALLAFLCHEGYTRDRVDATAEEPNPGAALAELIHSLLAMPIDVFALEGQPLEVRVPWWPGETLFFVPSPRDAEWLHRTEGIAPHRCWTATELSSLLQSDPSVTPEHLILLMVARREFDGEIVGVRPTLGRAP